MIEYWARTKPGQPALTGLIGSRHWTTRTYSQLLRRILALTKGLGELPPGRLGIVCGSHISTIEMVLAAISTGRQFVSIDLLRKPLSLQLFKLTNSKVDTLVIPSLEEMPDPLVDRINDLRRHFPNVKIVSTGENILGDFNLLEVAKDKVRFEHPHFSPESWTEPAALLYSPGRHGQPKGYFYQASAVCANTCAIAEWLKLNPKSRVLVAAAMDCCDGLFPVLATLSAGGTAIMLSQIDSGNFWKFVPECDADIVRVKPSLVEKLLDDHAGLESLIRSNLKFVVTGSSYLPRQIGLRFFETLDLPLLQSYGTAETGGYVLGMSPGLSWREYELALRDNIAGQELPFCNIKLKSDNSGDEISSSHQEEGVLHVRGQILSCGYWDGERINYWADPWLSTSDMAVYTQLQDQQYLQVRGRIEDTLLIDNQRIWPAFIERAMLDTFQFLRDCIAMTLPTSDGRSRLCAIIILPSDLPGHRRSELIALIEARLEAGGVSGLSEKCIPKEIIALDEHQVPRRYDGHPDRHQLHHLVSKQFKQQGMVAS